ncbi:type II secretion system F family protein, partial [bacterium]|nr:type II secretion system F family protein [bacterium]
GAVDLPSLCLLWVCIAYAAILGEGVSWVARRQLRQPGERRAVLPGAAEYRTVLVLGGAGAVAAAGSGFGPLAALAVLAAPLLFHALRAVAQRRWRGHFEDSGVLYFLALRALVRSGLGFASALERLARSQRTPFASAMRDRWRAFEQGADFLHCLDRFPESRSLPSLEPALGGLAVAYRQGLPLGPLLDRVAVTLEREGEQSRRARESRQAIMVQASIAFCVPWAILWVLFLEVPQFGWRLPPTAVAAALAAEALGVAVLWRLSQFEKPRRRRSRRELLAFLETCALSVSSGYDLAYAWKAAAQRVPTPELKQALMPQEPFAAWLVAQERSWPETLALWFSTLAELYRSGTSLAQSLDALAECLRAEAERDWASHQRSLPVKNSLVLAFFFVLPALGLVFAPLLAVWGESSY